MGEWREVQLAEVAEEVTVGHVGPMADQYRSKGVPFLRSQNVRPHRIDCTDIKFIDRDFHQSLRKSALAPGDVVTVRTGKPGTTAVIPESMAVANCADLVITRPGPDLDARWLSYYLNYVIDSHIGGHLVGAVQQHFNVQSAKKLVLRMPDIVEQRAISGVLGSLDDKIAANNLVAQTCLNLADLNFGREVREIESGARSFDDIAEIGGGGTPKTSCDEYWNGEIQWATPSDVTALKGPYLDATARTISDAGLAACSSSLYPAGSILMTSRATVGAFAIAQVPMAVNQGFIVVNAKESDLQWWLFHEMRSRVDEFVSYANGATFLELSRGAFKKLPVRLPRADVAQRFAETVAPLHRMAAQVQVESRMLARTRDELLPLLMSGKVRVKDAEAVVGDVP